jgi:hypothetical protein
MTLPLFPSVAVPLSLSLPGSMHGDQHANRTHLSAASLRACGAPCTTAVWPAPAAGGAQVGGPSIPAYPRPTPRALFEPSPLLPQGRRLTPHTTTSFLLFQAGRGHHTRPACAASGMPGVRRDVPARMQHRPRCPVWRGETAAGLPARIRGAHSLARHDHGGHPARHAGTERAPIQGSTSNHEGARWGDSGRGQSGAAALRGDCE